MKEIKWNILCIFLTLSQVLHNSILKSISSAAPILFRSVYHIIYCHSWSTLIDSCRIIHWILNLLTSDTFYNSYVRLPDADTPLASEIRNNLKLYPFFKDCQGSIDGPHLNAFCPDDAVKWYRNHKGGVSQNVLAECSQDMCFTYIVTSQKFLIKYYGYSFDYLIIIMNQLRLTLLLSIQNSLFLTRHRLTGIC